MSDVDPLNLTLAMPDASTEPTTPRVSSTVVFVSSTKSFHPDGLFSNEIFGLQGTPERSENTAHIDLAVDVIHPRIYKNLKKAVGLYDNIMAGKEYAAWDAKEKDFVPSNMDEGQTGYSFFIKHVNELVVKDSGSLSRQQLIKLLDVYKQRTIRYFPVLPAGLRDYVVDKEGKPTKDEINDIYVSIIGLANILDNETGKEADDARYALQLRIEEYVKYVLDDTLFGYINKRWVNRRVFGGVKNVMTASVQPTIDLDSPTMSRITDTQIGLFQAVKESPEHTIYAIQNGFLKNVFIENVEINVVDKKTLARKTVPFDIEFYEMLYNSEGIVKLMSSLRYKAARSRPLEYEGGWLAMIYENYDTNEVQILHDIGELHPSKDRSKVRPIDLSDLFYISAYERLHMRGAVANRHPVMDNGGIYIGNNYLKVTNKVTHMVEIDSSGEPTGVKYDVYPLYSSGYFTSVSPNPSRLGPLAGDNDGDMSGNIAVNTQEAYDEINARLATRSNYIGADGSLLNGLGAGVLPLVLASITA